MIKFSSRKKFVFIGVGLVLVLALIFLIKKPFGKADYKLSNVRRDTFVQSISLSGIVIPFRKTILGAPYSGYIKKVYVQVGDRVRVGDPLVEVVPSLLTKESTYPMRSPVTGIVVQVLKEEGESVREGDSKDSILRIDDQSQIFVQTMVPEIERLKIQTNQSVVIKASAIDNQVYHGKIRSLALAANSKEEWSRSQIVEYAARVEVVDADKNLQSGMSVLIDVVLAKKENALIVRHEAVRKDQDGFFVLMKNGDRRNISVGLQNDEGFEVLQGLQDGDQLQQIDFLESDGKSK